jgi:hypothetical protein
MTDDIDIAIVEALTNDDLREMDALLSQLSSTATFDAGRVQAMVDAPGVDLFVARDAGSVVGMATLVTFPLVTGWRGIVEDVVVGHQARPRHRPPIARSDHQGIGPPASSHARPDLSSVARVRAKALRIRWV